MEIFYKNKTFWKKYLEISTYKSGGNGDNEVADALPSPSAAFCPGGKRESDEGRETSGSTIFVSISPHTTIVGFNLYF